jgi:hypothetical protein
MEEETVFNTCLVLVDHFKTRPENNQHTHTLIFQHILHPEEH